MELINTEPRSEHDDKTGEDFFARLKSEGIINNGLKKEQLKQYKKPIEWGDEIKGRFVKQKIHIDDKLAKQFLEMRKKNIL
jgi:hypothetical protein